MTRVAFWKRDNGTRIGALERDALPVSGQSVGRAAELARFEAALESRQKVVVSVTGEYGLGKTELLRRFQQTATVRGLATAYTETTGKGLPAMLAGLAGQLEQRGCQLRSFSDRYRTYRQRLDELETDPQAPKGLATLAAGTLAKGGVRAARHIPVAGFAFELVSEDAAATVAAEVTNYVLARVGNKDEVELVLEPVPTLTRLFLDDLRAVADQQPIGLFLDADDTSYRDLEAWLLDVVRQRYGALPAAVIVAVASTRELDRANWVSFEEQIDRIELGPLSEADARLYLEQAGVTNEAVVDEILRRSGGIPLSLAVLAAQRPEGPEQVGDPNGSAVDGFLSSVSEPARRRLAVDGSVPRIVNRDVLCVVFAKDDALDDFVWLTGLPFLKDTEQGWVYSDPVREQLLLRSRRDAPQSWTKLQRTLATYYEGLAAELSVDEDDRTLDREWQRCELEATYHALCSGARSARHRVLNGFMAAFAGERRFAQRYGEAIRQAGADLRDDRLAQLGDLLARGAAAIDDASPEEAITMLETLLESGELEDRWRAKALDWRGFLTATRGDFEAALADFDAALELEPDSVEYLVDRARTLERIGRYDDALRDLDRASSIEPENPLVLMLRAETHQLADRLDEALADVKRVLELQPKNAAAWMLQADVQQLKHELGPALASLDRALEIEPDNAGAWAAHGRVQQASGHPEEALQDLDRAVELAPDDFGILALRANLLGRIGKLEQAADAIRDLIRRSKEFFEEYSSVVSSIPPEGFKRRSARFASLAGLDEREAARQAESFAGGPESVTRVLKADLAVLESLMHLKGENIEAAIADYGRAIELDPDRASLWSSRAGLLMRTQRADEALTDVDRAIELAPGDYTYVALRWGILATKGDLAGAAAAARTVADHADDYVRQLAATAVLAGLTGPSPAHTTGPPSAISTEGKALLELAATNPTAAVRAVGAAADAMQAVLLMSQNDVKGALASYDDALKLDPSQPALWISKGQLELQLGNVDGARAAFDGAVEAQPENAQAWATRAHFHLSQRNLDEALADIDRAIELAPENYTLISVRALIFQAGGNLVGFAECAEILAEHAEDYVDQATAAGRATAVTPGQALDSVFGSGFGAAAAGQLAQFVEDRDAAVRQVRAEAPVAKALLLQTEHDFVGAIEAWTLALEIGGPRADWLLERGELLRLAGRLDEALADFDRLVELDDQSAAGRGSRGQVLRALDRPEEAIAEFDRALELDDTLVWVYLERGELHRLAERFEPALSDFDRMTELSPESAVAHGSRGQVLRALDRPEEALSALNRAVELDDELLWARVERGALYLDGNRWEDAEAEFSRVLASEPDNVRGLVEHGRALVGLGRFEDALADLDRAIGLDPDVGLSYAIRGEAHFMRRDTQAALADFERAVELGPDWPWAQSRLSEILQLASRPEEGLAAIEAALKPSDSDDWMRYVRALAQGSVGNPDAARRDLDWAITAAEQHGQDGADRPRHLLNAAVYRLARQDPGDVEEAKRLFHDVAPASDSHRRDVIRDLETLSSLRDNPTAASIAATLAAE